MPLLYRTDRGRWESIREADVDSALASGDYQLAKGNIPVVSPDGRVGTMPSEYAVGAIQSGFKYHGEEAERKRQIVSSVEDAPAEAALAGFADVATFGLYSKAPGTGRAGLTGNERKMRLKALADQNPWARAAGQVVGAIAPVGAGGAIGALGRGARAAMAAKAAQGGWFARTALPLAAEAATEGALLGAAELVHEEAIGDAEFNAESILAHVGGGALVGGALGAGLGVTGAGLKAAAGWGAKKVTGGKIGEWLEGFADESAIGAVVGKQKRAWKQLEGKNLTNRAARIIREDIGFDKLGNTTEQMAVKLEAHAAKLKRQLDDMVGSLDEAAGAGAVSAKDVANLIRTHAQKNYGQVALKSERDFLLRSADEIEELGAVSMTAASAERRAAQMQAKYNQLDPAGLQEAKRVIPRIWNDVIDDTAAPHLKASGLSEDAFRSLRHDEWATLELSKYAADRTAGNKVLNTISLMEGMYGSAGFVGGVGLGAGGPAGLAVGMGAALGRKAWRTYGKSWSAMAAGRLSNMKALRTAAEATRGKIDKVARVISAGKRLKIMPAAVSLTSVHFGHEKPPKAKDRRQAAAMRSGELAKMLSDPEAMATRVAANMSAMESWAPKTAASVAALTAKVVQFLEQRAPKSMPGPTLTPLASSWVPSEDEAATFERYVRAAMDPGSVLDDIAAGTLSPEGVETLRELYPRMYEETKQAIANAVAERREPLPYNDRVQLSLLFGMPLDDTMLPAFIAAAQSGTQRAQRGGPQAPEPIRSTGKPPTLHSRSQTKNQRIEATL